MTARPQRPGTPLSHGLTVKNRVWNAWLRVENRVLALRAARRGNASRIAPRRVLFAVGGHLGDAVIATAAIAALKHLAPDIEAGVVSGAWNERVFAGNPDVARFHAADHWKLDRSGAGLVSRIRRSRASMARATTELRAAGYDTAIDLSAHYPNFALLLWTAGIGVRVGYPTGGRSALYTTVVPWRADLHTATGQLALVRAAAAQVPADARLHSVLPAVTSESVATVTARANINGRYVVVHPGAGEARKEWTVAGWRAVIAAMQSRGVTVVLTGAGGGQRALTAALAGAESGVVDVADRLTWDEFRTVIAGAQAVVSVDTVAMHIAAAYDVPTVALMTAMDDPARWRPLGANVTVLTHPVPCAPCYRSRGCSGMECVQSVRPDAVIAAIDAVR